MAGHKKIPASALAGISQSLASRALLEITPEKLAALSDDDFIRLTQEYVDLSRQDHQENALLSYVPVSEKALRVHTSTKQTVGIGGGNRSSKTETCLAEFVACATGVVPKSLDGIGIDWKAKCKGPMDMRIVVESLTTTLYNTILPKLQYFRWTGLLPTGREGGQKGHYGWIPRKCLKNGSWEESWQDKIRTLSFMAFDVEDPERPMGMSTIQFMSHDQDPTDFASGQFHMILLDEPSTFAIWKENQARAMSVGGRIFLAMTWPDDPVIPVDWIFDEVYEPARGGHETIDWIELHTLDNQNIDQQAVSAQAEKWDKRTRDVRLFGKPIRHANLIHPDFTDATEHWCFACRDQSYIEDTGACRCGSRDIVPYCHVRDFDVQEHWPVVFLLDPHPRKPHFGAWYAIDPADDFWGVDEIVESLSPKDFRIAVEERETEHRMRIAMRLIDPNMGGSPSSTDRETTWQDSFWEAGLGCDLADDGGAGRMALNDVLRPDLIVRAPRIHWHPRCKQTIFQMKRYVWDEYKQSLEKDQKQVPRNKHDDFPTLAKYLMNANATFRGLRGHGQVIHRLPALQGTDFAVPRDRAKVLGWHL